MFKKVAFSLTLFILCALVFFGIGEICFRIFRGPPNPLTGIVQTDPSRLFKPSFSERKQSSVPGEFDYTVHTNKYGYRGPDFAMPKVPGKLRIMAVGDSFTFGVGAEDQKTIPSLIEERLKKQGMNVEVINAGIGHTGPAKHYINIRDIHLKYMPDVILLLFDLTDLWDDWHTERHGVFDKDGELVRFDLAYVDGHWNGWLWAIEHSAFCKYFNNKVVRSFKKMQQLGLLNYIKIVIQGKRAKAAIINAHDAKSQEAQIEYDGMLLMRGREEKELIDAHWPRTVKYLTKILDLLSGRYIPLVIVMYPHGIYAGDEQWDKGREAWGFERHKTYTDYYAFELMADFARARNIPFINTTDAFLKAQPRPFFFDYDGHMNPAGNVLVAQSLVASPQFLEILKK